MSKYLVGDILEVVGNVSGHGFVHGEVIEIVNNVDFGGGDLAYSAKGEHDQWLILEQDLSDLTFDPPSKQPDMVNSPAHYGNGSIECIEYIEDFLTTEEFIGYLRGNIAKYLHRFRYKNGIEDLKKAEWYLGRLTEVMEDQECLKS
jgi:hypothetical protein